MPIRVTCPQCHTRFNVSDQFAGREGPCPKCKTKIKIPEKDQEVVIDVPDDAPKDSKGRSVLKPIRRQETKLSSVQITLIAVGIVGFLLAALIMRISGGGDASKFPGWLQWVAAVVLAPPIVYSAYTFLRDQDLGSFDKTNLRNRVLICSAIYALLWLAMPLGRFAFNGDYNMGSWMTALIPMLGIGAAAGMLSFDFDYLIGLVHYGMYVGICLIGRLIAGIGVLPGALDQAPAEEINQFAPSAMLLIEHAQRLITIVMQ